jgi:predicted PurR-regulated permease PerM
MKKIIIILLIISLILPSFSFGQKLPENWEDFQKIGQGLWDKFWQGLRNAWEEAIKIWKKVIGWIVNIWNSYIFPFLKFIWQKIWNFFLKIINLILENIWQKIKEMIK